MAKNFNDLTKESDEKKNLDQAANYIKYNMVYAQDATRRYNDTEKLK